MNDLLHLLQRRTLIGRLLTEVVDRTPRMPTTESAPHDPSDLNWRQILLVGVVVLVGAQLFTGSKSGGASQIAAWGLLGVYGITIWFGWQRSLAPLILVSGMAAAVLETLGPANPAFVATIAAIAITGGRLDWPVGAPIALVTAVAFILAAVFGPHQWGSTAALSTVPGLAFAYVAAASMRQLRRAHERAQALLQEVLANREAQVRAATLDERARLAREIHDVLAHTLSALSVQLEGTRMLLEQRPDDPAALAAVERAGRLARDGIDEARRAVRALRGDHLPGPDLLPRLAEDFERDSGVPCRFDVEGEPVDLPSEARLALYRTAQVALTNVRKHADARSVLINLRYLPGVADLTVEDEGNPRTTDSDGMGHGLQGMRERAELAGGTLEAGATPVGYRVHLRLPA
jgi:signal transduction histidine kinase